ncbi:ABC transporter substrate-binding protein [Psychrilyobacter atlanticus]|uniref:ABC transporter substrate-binding protein n=1 Tax=Psychrilyobacter atlanticus TaxID=271091 RepID=UPI0003FCB356|nr:ABC transporter substrate-binding protein [Psychrilyobacter atlanticus]
MKKLIGLLVLLILVITGCGKEKPSNENTLKTKVDGGELVVRISQDMDFLDPHKALAAGTYEVMFNVFEGLLKPTHEGKLIPAVAESFKISKDNLTYTFKLRDGIKFHNGRDVQVEDIIFSLTRIGGDFSGNSVVRDLAKNIKNIKKIDNNTVAIELKKVDGTILSKFTTAIIPRDVVDIEQTPIGTGPFKFIEYLPGQKLVMEKFSDYWIKGVPSIDKVEFSIIKDEQSSILSLQRGEIDLYPRMGSTHISTLENTNNIIVTEQNLMQILSLNNKVKPFDDLRVRQAIAYAIDSEEIIDTLDAGLGKAIGTNMSPVMKNYYNIETEGTYTHNIEKAKELLKEAGYENGFEFTLSLPTNYRFHADTGVIISEQLKKVGIKANLVEVEWGTWLKDIYAGRKYEGTIIALDGKIEPYDILNRYISNHRRNFMNYESKEYDAVMEKITQITDEKIKTELYKEAQMILAQDIPVVFIMAPAGIIATNKDLRGYTPYPIYVQDISTLYFVK